MWQWCWLLLFWQLPQVLNPSTTGAMPQAMPGKMAQVSAGAMPIGRLQLQQ
jgi:hypothetical protein